MALFWSKKPKAEKNYDTAKTVKVKKVGEKAVRPVQAAAVAARAVSVAAPTGHFSSVADAIIRSHITEKSGLLSQGGSYTFVVARAANKDTISKAVAALYKVRPVKVAVLNQASKTIFVRGRRGTVPGFRKAIVTLKKGDKIDFV